MQIGGEAYGFGVSLDTKNDKKLNDADNAALVTAATIQSQALFDADAKQSESFIIIAGIVVGVAAILFLIWLYKS